MRRADTLTPCRIEVYLIWYRQTAYPSRWEGCVLGMVTLSRTGCDELRAFPTCSPEWMRSVASPVCGVRVCVKWISAHPEHCAHCAADRLL